VGKHRATLVYTDLGGREREREGGREETERDREEWG